MKPSTKLLKIITAFMAVYALLWTARLFMSETPPLIHSLESILIGIAIIIAIFALIDGYLLWKKYDCEISREILGGFSQSTENNYWLNVKNPTGLTTSLQIHDGLPPSFRVTREELIVTLAPNEKIAHEYAVIPEQRGDFTIAPAWITINAPWGLWQKLIKRGEPTEIQVYPNFASYSGSVDLGLEQQIQQIGVHLLQRRGEGMDFKQLRNYTHGDSPNQVDWKSTARLQKLIAREYQDERDQTIFFLLDCGHRMRAEDQGLSYFDHAVHALLITSFIALKQGDSVGLVSFAGDSKWVPPIKGSHGMKYLLNQTYDLKSSPQTSDYLELAQEFVQKHSKRSLVILISSLHSDDYDDLLTTVSLLKRKHIVMVVTIDEPFIENLHDHPVESEKDAQHYASMVSYMHGSNQLMAKLRAAGVIAVHANVNALSATITREYLRLKRAGRI